MVSESDCNWLKTQPADQVDLETVAILLLLPPECRVRDYAIRNFIEKAIND